MATIFFKTEKISATGLKMQALIDIGKDISDEIENYVIELGGNEKYLMRGRAIFGTGINGIHFKEKPDMKVWKAVPNFLGYYRPRLTSKKGKEIEAKFNSFDSIERGDINMVIGFDDFLHQCGFDNGNNEFFGFQISSSWNHTMPKDCTEITFTEYITLFQNEN